MSTSYLGELEQKAQDLERDKNLLDTVYKAFSDGKPVDASHYSLRSVLLDFDDVEEFVYSTRKRLKDELFTGAYAVVGEYGTGKTQYGFFLKHALEGGDVKVIYRELCRPRDLIELRDQAFQLVESGYNVVLIIDNLDVYLSLYEGDPREEAKVARRLATFVEMLSERPHETERGLRGVALFFLTHTDSLRLLCEKDERLRRIRVIKELRRLREAKEGEKLALSVLAVLYAHDEDCRLAVKKCGESLVELLAKWGASLLEVKGRMGKGLFIKTCFEFFTRILRGLGRCPAEATQRGFLVEGFLADVLRQDVFYVRTKKEVLSAKVVHRKSGPDLEIRLYRGGLPVGAPSLVIYGEVKSVKNTLKHCSSQLVRYARERPLLLIVLAEDVDAVETELQALESQAPVAGLVYPLTLIEPIALVKRREESASLLRGLLGRDLISDVEWRVASLIAAERPAPPKAVNTRAIAQELISAAKLRAERAKQVQVGRVKNKVVEVFAKRGLKVGDPEQFAETLLTTLAQEGFLTQVSQRTFKVVPSAWRERWEEALEAVSKIVAAQIGQ